MNEVAVTRWLIRRRRTDFWLSLATALMAFVLGVGVVFLTFWFGYLLVYLGESAIDAVAGLLASGHARLSHTGRLIGAGCFVALLFIGNARTSQEELDDLPKARYGVPPALTMRAGLVGGLIVLLAYPGASSRFLAVIFFSGPRLVVGAWKLLVAALRAARIDVTSCTTVLALLLERGQAVGYDEWEALGLEAGVEQLRGLDGVVFLEKGVSLTSDLRSELARS